jgi:hypothetical protein
MVLKSEALSPMTVSYFPFHEGAVDDLDITDGSHSPHILCFLDKT